MEKKEKQKKVKTFDRVSKEKISKEKISKERTRQGCLACQECRQCSGQKESYAEHVAMKQKRLQEALESFVKPQKMIIMEQNAHYKNRVHRIFHHERNGTPICGYFSTEEGRVVKIEECYIDDKQCEAIIHSVKGLLKSFKIKTYDVRSERGLLRYVSVRRGMKTNEILVTLVLSSVIMPSKNNFVKALRKLHPEITTIVISENYKNMDNIYGEKEVNLYGKGFISDQIADKSFRIGVKSQFTLNPFQSEKVCNVIQEWGTFQGTELVLDAYCGVGMYGVMISDKVRRIISVEANQEMYREAIANVRKNNIKNIDVYKNNPAEFVKQVVNSEKEKMDVAMVSQPYSGCGKDFIDVLSKARPRKIIMITRNLGAMREELSLLVKAGYRVEKAVGVDVHPWTERIETVVLLSHR